VLLLQFYREEGTAMKARDIWKLVVSIVASLAAGAIGSIFTRQAIPTWYATLEKPAFNPPNWVFMPVWTLLYIMMGVAAFLVWRKGLENRQVRIALIVFLVQLVLNALWSVAFFGLESPLFGLIVIAALWVAILFTTLMFYRISWVAGVLMLPYLLWVTFAAVLNESIWLLNR
jgi:tryptophan-rich sensory protein